MGGGAIKGREEGGGRRRGRKEGGWVEEKGVVREEGGEGGERKRGVERVRQGRKL